MYVRFILLLMVIGVSLNAQQKKIILDADTGNEVDDLYAIVRALIEPSWNIMALNAAQWQSSQWAVDQSMEESHRLNQVLVGYLKMEEDVKTLRGGIRRMNDWGDKAQHSAGSYWIIKQAHLMPDGEHLTVVVLGALTNVASKMKVNYQATEDNFKGKHPLSDFLLDRWINHLDGSRYERTIWDLALIGAMIHPEWAEEEKGVNFENPNIWLYKDIDSEAIIQDFYITTLNYLE